MKILIDIPENYYNDLMSLKLNDGEHLSYEMEMIRHGTPLPKRHGRLIDADALLVSDEECSTYASCFECRMNTECCGDFVHIINKAPTIIEADKEEEHEQ